MSTFGRVFRITTYGESHGKSVGVIVDGVPPCMPLVEADIQTQLNRRKPGQSAVTTARNEPDEVFIQSGTENGITLGTPICLLVKNMDQRPKDYNSMSKVPRPSHADFTYQVKYDIKAVSGGGRSSARETIGRVAGGAVAERWLNLQYGIEIVAWVSSVGDLKEDPKNYDQNTITRAIVDASPVRCPDLKASEEMVKAITAAKEEKDSMGGIITCVCRNVPVGWGEPVFDKLEAMLAHAMLSIPATKGFEIGSGFEGTKMRGSLHNDPFVLKSNGKLGTSSNNSGGVQGGISNGENIYFRVAFKPPATIGKAQETAEYLGEPATLKAEGRHDPCVAPRAVSIVEAMAALVLADAAMIQLARQATHKPLQSDISTKLHTLYNSHQ
uniref:Chorismate synthase n=1 Tax=Arcella intermedia TaxID=1963864 RepID=A0A6B2L6V8_9EUKA|eukprot:TRINITY_DN913_c0_g1_i1.p1 TRINITY_DN913_c0_g1~~TRINITY_DN913_c0_g1_i1.p1  ORF type:complete len:384 (-),score=64.40 TRINITY_DN913_c0_g1_i1:88-1239(-)